MRERKSWLPPGGTNLFQEIKDQILLVKDRGIDVVDMSIGEPTEPALSEAVSSAIEALEKRSVEIDGYQDNRNRAVSNFDRIFAQHHITTQLEGRLDVEYLNTIGTKSMINDVIRACGSQSMLVGTHTNPGYPTPAIQCGYQYIRHYALDTNPANDFLFNLKNIKEGTKLLMLNFPHNPSGQIATKEFWNMVCAYCQKKGIRLVNDAAYTGLAYSKDHCTLADVAINYPWLSWVEIYTASKKINVPGWRVGSMAGSPDFIRDIAKIKGNTDSGPAGPLVAGVMGAILYDQAGMDAIRNSYKERLYFLIKTLESQGMQLAVQPRAGFFTLWNLPSMAFGETVVNAKDFNDRMIELGIAGVPFDGDDRYIRYAVVENIIPREREIIAAFKKADVSY